MSSKYPGALDALDTSSANETASQDTHPALHNDANAAVNAVQEALGLDPEGAHADVAARLATLLSGELPIDLTGATAKTPVLRIAVNGEEKKRLVLRADGRLTWDSPTHVGVSELYLSPLDSIGINDDLIIEEDNLFVIRENAETAAIVTQKTGEGADHFRIKVDGRIEWADAAGNFDKALYRTAEALKTDGIFRAVGNIYSDGKIEAADESGAETSIGAMGPGGTPAIEFNSTDLYLDESGEKRKLLVQFPGGAAQLVAEEP